MTKEQWIRVNELLVKDYDQFQQDYKESDKGKTPKKRRLAARNAGFAIGRAQWYISDREGARLLLEDYLTSRPYSVEEFFQPSNFQDEMKGFLELVGATIASFEIAAI